jgi:hypothetical protein
MPSCENDETAIAENIGSISSNSNGYVVEDGYLSFTSQDAFNEYFMQVENALGNNGALKSSSSRIVDIEGFVPLVDMVGGQSSLKSGNSSEEEVFVEILNELIPVEPLHYLLDTISRVKVCDDIFQITPFGTFVYKKEFEEEFFNLIETLPDKLFDYSHQIDSVTYMFGNVKLIDTYKHIENQLFDENAMLSSILDEDNSDESSGTLKSASSKIDSKLTTLYGLENHKVNGGVFHDNNRSNYFDSNTRVRVRLYDYDFGVYKGAGFTCKFQKKKKQTVTVRKYGLFGPKREITLYTYWSSTINPEIAIGIDFFEGYTEFTDFGLSVDENGFPINYNHHKTFSKGIASLVKKGTNYLFEDVRGWADRGWLFETKLKFNIGSNDVNLLREAYDAGTDVIMSEVRSQVYNTVQTAAPTRYIKRDEKLYPNRRWVTYWGVNEYKNRGHIDVTLGLPSYGIPAPNKFHIKEVYIFGAAKYNGKWKGVRLYM